MSEVNRREYNKQHPTLCWDCAKATGGCNWSDRLCAIPGWKIIPTKKIKENYSYTSCIVLECPQFKRDAYKNGLVRYEKDSIYKELEENK